MAEKFNGFEGQSPSTAITTANSGAQGDDAFDPASAGGGTLQYSDAQAAFGDMSARIVAATGQAPLLRHTIAGTRIRMRAYCRFDARPIGDVTIVQARHASGGRASLKLAANGDVKLDDAGGFAAVTHAGAISPATWYGISLTCQRGMTSSDGQVRVALYELDGSEVGSTYSSTTRNMGTTDLVAFQVGHHVSGEPGISAYWDSFGVSDESGDYGPIIELDPPTADVSLGGAYRLIDASASTAGEGGVLSYDISPSAGVIDLADGRFLVPVPQSAQDDYEVTVTESPSGLDNASPISVSPDPRGVTRVYDDGNWV